MSEIEIFWDDVAAHLTANRRRLEELIDDRTSVVCLSHVEYGTGQTHDLKRYAEAEPTLRSWPWGWGFWRNIFLPSENCPDTPPPLVQHID